MGDQNVSQGLDARSLGQFEKALLADLHALEHMLDTGVFESGVRRVGAEQEMVLVDRARRPWILADDVRKAVDDPRVVPELARWNLEANLSPRLFGGACLREMEDEMTEVVSAVDTAAHERGASVLLTGICPTLRLADLSLGNMTPNPRYFEMNDALKRLRGDSFMISINGLDELYCRHENIMLESANTSFQVHFQVGPSEFAKLYNLAQAVAGPVIAAAANSPLFVGRRLWHETRVALFQSSVDTRNTRQQARKQPPRVMFGDDYIEDSILEIFREDISRFRVILASDKEPDPMALLERGEWPGLKALCLHNSTVWRWNRACYGNQGERPHLRIENRVLPAGPTIIDEVANAAFFFGLMSALGDEYGPIDKVLAFDDAKNNFLQASRYGLKAQFTWLRGETLTARELVLTHLLPLARKGLEHGGIDSRDIDRYLGVVEARVEAGQTGANWALESLRDIPGTEDEKLRTLTTAMLEGQRSGQPVHNWPPATPGSGTHDVQHGYATVGQFMSSDLYTCQPEDVVDLVANMMQWKKLRYVLVEDDDGNLRGIVSMRDLLRLVARDWGKQKDVIVSEIMKADPWTVTPETSTVKAMRLMRDQRIGCLPVVEDGHAVGVITAYDFLDVSARLLEHQLRDAAPENA